MGAHHPALGLLLLLLCPAQVTRAGWAGRGGAVRQLRAAARETPGGRAAGVGKLVFRCSRGGRLLLLCLSIFTLSCALGEGDSWGLWLALSYSSGGHLI